MTARRNYIFTNKYIPTATKTDLKWYKRDLSTWFNELKFKEATDNPYQYFLMLNLLIPTLFTATFEIHSYKNRLRNIRQFIKMILMDTTKNLWTKCLVQHIDLNEKMFFWRKI